MLKFTDGFDYQGKVGNGTYNQTNAPTEVKTLGGSVVAVGAGLNHACAIVAAGLQATEGAHILCRRARLCVGMV